MDVIDSQVHAYEANMPKRPWQRVPNWPDHVTGDETVAAMENVGVHGAILVSPFALYRYDGSYAMEVQRRILTSSPSSNRSTRTIWRWPKSSATGRELKVRSAFAS